MLAPLRIARLVASWHSALLDRSQRKVLARSAVRRRVPCVIHTTIILSLPAQAGVPIEDSGLAGRDFNCTDSEAL
jgi:hypothetical protein